MKAMSVSEVAAAIGCTAVEGESGQIVRRVSTDSRETLPGDLFVAIRGPNFDGAKFIPQAVSKGAVACVCEQGASPDGRGEAALLRVADSVTALGKLGTYYRKKLPASAVVIAVTGSNGKTTTKCMIDHILSRSFRGKASPKSFNNRIGLPLTLLTADFDDSYVVSEIGTNARGEINALASMATPDVGVITSVGEAHLEGLGGLRGVAEEKTALLSHVRAGGLCVVNIDCPEIRPYLSRASHARLVTVGVDSSAKLQVTRRASSIRGSEFELDGRFHIRLPMPGAHHATNAAAAFAVARWFGMEPREIIDALGSFVPPAGRTQRFEVGGLTIIDDSYNANPGSVRAAIEALCSPVAGRRVLVLGDMLELGEESMDLHVETLRFAAKSSVDVIVGVGRKVSQAVSAMAGEFSRKTVHCVATTEAVCPLLDSVLMDGDTVWIKASRAMELDRAVKHLRERWTPRAAVA